MKIILNGNPISTNHIYKFRGHMMYMTRAGRDLKESYQWQATSQWKQKVTDKPLDIYIKLFFGDKRIRDIDNFSKILLDSLTGIVWKNDNQIQSMSIRKYYDKKNPRIEVEIF